jgi:hypothetical protein
MITNAKDKLISSSPALPNVSGAINLFLQKVTLKTLVKEQVEGRTQETSEKTFFNVLAAKQPYKPQETDIKEEGQRAWKWFRIRVSVDLGVKIDDIIVLREVNYRVMSISDAREYGSVNYIVCEAFQ